MPSPEPPNKKSIGMTPEEREAFFNRINVSMAKREALVDSWFVAAGVPIPPKKSEEQLKAEDAALFRNEPPHLGLGAPIPSWWLVSEAQNNNKSLRDKFFPAKGLQGSKARDKEEKAASAKRGLRVESSDEEEGRSGLGRAKKMKMAKRSEPTRDNDDVDSGAEPIETTQQAIATPTTNNKKSKVKSKPVKDGGVITSTGKITTAEAESNHQSSQQALQSTADSDGKSERKWAKEERRRAKEESRKSRQESLDHVDVDAEPEKTAKPGKEERRHSKQQTVEPMDVDPELEQKRVKPEQKKSKTKSDKHAREHSQESVEVKIANIQPAEKGLALLPLSDSRHKHSGNSEENATRNKPESEESASGEDQVTLVRDNPTLLKEQKKRDKKQKKRERKRMLQAAKQAAETS